MSKREELDGLQYSAQVRLWGLRFQLFAIEVMTARAAPATEPKIQSERCTSGWGGICIRLAGKTEVASYKSGTFEFVPGTRWMRVNHLQFASHQLISPVARFLLIRFGSLKTRHKLIESDGAQAHCVIIEKVEPKKYRKRKQLVISSTEGEGTMNESDPEQPEGEGGEPAPTKQA
ncbi:hypothetical protein HX878_21045 [Pseudomonas veronii]|uniref:hypothetical protein n=1 Tax=Pseudomonas veronii TaxID=76761 RepID=UPI00159FA249|nr:hypothetical protein [Pseudomonas veronii]NWD57219.1 hypothetical protein [Pseudomonas veronii]